MKNRYRTPLKPKKSCDLSAGVSHRSRTIRKTSFEFTCRKSDSNRHKKVSSSRLEKTRSVQKLTKLLNKQQPESQSQRDQNDNLGVPGSVRSIFEEAGEQIAGDQIQK